MIQVEEERGYNMVLVYKINCHAVTTAGHSGAATPPVGDTPSPRAFFHRDFRDHVVQPSFEPHDTLQGLL